MRWEDTTSFLDPTARATRNWQISSPSREEINDPFSHVADSLLTPSSPANPSDDKASSVVGAILARFTASHRLSGDVSAICSSAVFDILLRRFPAERIMYGSDGFAGWSRGKYIWWGYTWEWMRERVISTCHASSETTFVLYEELRALGHSLRYAEWSPQQIEALFWDNAIRLLHGK